MTTDTQVGWKQPNVFELPVPITCRLINDTSFYLSEEDVRGTIFEPYAHQRYETLEDFKYFIRDVSPTTYENMFDKTVESDCARSSLYGPNKSLYLGYGNIDDITLSQANSAAVSGSRFPLLTPLSLIHI